MRCSFLSFPFFFLSVWLLAALLPLTGSLYTSINASVNREIKNKLRSLWFPCILSLPTNLAEFTETRVPA